MWLITVTHHYDSFRTIHRARAAVRSQQATSSDVGAGRGSRQQRFASEPAAIVLHAGEHFLNASLLRFPAYVQVSVTSRSTTSGCGRLTTRRRRRLGLHSSIPPRTERASNRGLFVCRHVNIKLHCIRERAVPTAGNAAGLPLHWATCSARAYSQALSYCLASIPSSPLNVLCERMQID